MGIASEADLRENYFRMPVIQTRARIAEMVGSRRPRGGRRRGVAQSGYLAPGARIPRRVAACALLSPFDNLIWARERTSRLFGARIGSRSTLRRKSASTDITVLPFLLGEAIVARVDLKADRKEGVLIVQAAHLEPGAEAAEVAPALAGELQAMARWLGLQRRACGQ